MKSILLFLTVFFSLSGCVGPQVIPSNTTLQAISKIRVVAMEAPPIFVIRSEKVSSTIGSAISQTSATNSNAIPFPPVPTPLKGAQIGGIVTAIMAISGLTGDHPEIDEQLGRLAQSTIEFLNPGILWEPTLAIADEVNSHLSASGWSTTRSTSLQPIAGVERLPKWQDPHNYWYNAEISPYGYASHNAMGTESILEVAISYGFQFDRFQLNIWLKLVDASSQKVLGKTRDYALIELSDRQIKMLFSDGGSSFKELFSATGQKLVRQCLSNLNLDKRR